MCADVAAAWNVNRRRRAQRIVKYADVAELVDALASGASVRKDVEVQVLSSVPFQSKNPNRRLSGRFFGSHFLIPATDKNHFPPPFGKWFLSLRLRGFG